MLKEILEKLEEVIQTEHPEIYVRRYKGEFEEGADWNPDFPCFLYRLTKAGKAITGMTGASLINEARITAYIADRDMNSPAALDVIEDLIELDGMEIELIKGKYFRVRLDDENGFQFYGYGPQVEVYTMHLIVEY
jgi:hypothetical protein